MAIGIFTQSTQAFAICSGQMTKLINCFMIFLPPKGDAEENPVRPEKNRFYCYSCFINKNVFLFNCPCFSPLIDRKQARLRRSFFFLKQHKVSSISQYSGIQLLLAGI
jgi:hypothetical protein